MPLPDANKHSDRVYELLKETDLANLSYSQYQSVVEKLFIEPENEDEMRRAVLIQLAKTAVRGSWDGFLSGGSGGAPTDAQYVVMSLDGTLTNERVLTQGTGISITDGGAGGNVTIASTVTGTIEGSIANTQVAVGSAADTIAGSGSLTYNSATLNVSNQIELGDVGAAGVLKNSNNNQDMRIQVAGTGNVRIENQTTNTASQLNVKGNGSGTPKVALSNDTKAITLQCDTNQKLTVKGGTDEFVLDASSATGGITFPDGTTQTTAASGGGAFAVLPDLVNVTYTTTTSQYQDIHGVYNSGFGDVNISCNNYQSFFWYRPFYAMTTATLSKIHLRMNGGTAGNTADFAIYNSDSDGKPNTKIGSITSANISVSGSLSFSIVEESTGSMSLTKGELYWVGIKCSTTGSWATIRGRNGYETTLLGYSNLGATQLEAYTVIVGNATAGTTFSAITTGQKQAVMLGGEYA